MKNCFLCNRRLKHLSANRKYCKTCKDNNPWARTSEGKALEYSDRVKRDKAQRYSIYSKGAFKRQLSFALTYDEFCSYWQKPCYYCGEEIDTIGIDRYLNEVGYSPDNIVPCCKYCNFMKRDMDGDEFIAQCLRIAANTK